MPTTRIQNIIVLSLLAPFVLAVPTLPVYDYVPRDAHVLRLDTRTNQVTIYGRDMQPVATARSLDALRLPKRDSGSKCTLLNLEEAKRLPGWKAIVDTAVKSWGTGSYNLEVNPKDYPDRGASVCVQDAPVQLQLTGKPQCNPKSSSTKGQVAGTNGRVEMEISVGTEMTSEMTVTKVSVIGVSATVGVSVGFKGIAEASASTTVSSEFTNSLTTHKSQKVSTFDKQKIAFDSPPGAQCHAELSLNQCTQSGKGNLDYIASGFVWFNFNDKTHDHYKWCVNIESAVPNVKDRSSQMEFEAMMSSSTQGSYNVFCDGKKIPVDGDKSKAAAKTPAKTPAGKTPGGKPAAKPAAKPADKPAAKPQAKPAAKPAPAPKKP